MLIKTSNKWLIIVVLVALALSGCRYWSLYRFSQQFCDFDQHIEVLEKDRRVGFHLIDPVLPRLVFTRYLAAPEYFTVQDKYVLYDTYQIQSASDDRRYSLFTHYHLGSQKSLMIAGELDTELSQLFPTVFVEPILRSFCAEDYDLSLSQLDARMTIEKLSPKVIPTKDAIVQEFGSPISETSIGKRSELVYTFYFVAQEETLQSKPMIFTLEFQNTGNLSKMRVQYHKYDYRLDFEEYTAELKAIRRL